MKITQALLAGLFISSVSAQAQTSPSLRSWVDQQGRSIKASLVKVDGPNVVLQLENGSTATVPLARFSAGDQAFAKQQGAGGSSTSASKGLEWPALVSVNKKDLEITTGEQDATNRQFVYESGSFQFISQAQLTGTVMRDIASDFELTSTLFKQLPWGWEPKPRDNKKYFLAKLFETEKDYIAGGGAENSSGSSKDDYVITKFSTLGLKKVGERYAFDAKLKKDGGDMVALIARLLMTDMRGLCEPWSAVGMEQLLQHVAYRNGSFAFTTPERALKIWLEQRRSGGYQSSVDRLITVLKTDWSGPQSTTVTERIQNNMDYVLLVYFFGFLDDDGKGARLHHYFSAISKDGMAFRSYNAAGRKGPPPWTGSFSEHAAELNSKIIIGDRPDDKLKELIATKFKSIGIKL